MATGATERVQALAGYGIMDTAAEAAFDELTQLAAELFRAPVALVSLLDDKRQWFKSRVGIEDTETPIEHAFCAHAIRGADVMVVPDARDDPRFADNPLVTGDAAIRFYAGAPLIAPDGVALGTLCVIDRMPRQNLGVREKQILKRLAGFVMIELEYRRLAREAERQLGEAVALIELELTAQRAMPAADPVSQAHAVRAVAERVDLLKDRCYRMATLLEGARQRGG
jgi:GAF domain-containing protein